MQDVINLLLGATVTSITENKDRKWKIFANKKPNRI